MKKFVVFMFSVVLMGSCSSEITLTEQIKYDWDINYISFQDDGDDKQYNFHKNLKNSSFQNQREIQLQLPTVKNSQDFLASNDKVEPSVLTNNYSYKKLPQIIQNKKTKKPFLEKAPIFEKKKSSNKSKIKAKKNKVLKIIGTSLLIFFTTIIIGITAIIISWNYGNSFGEIAFNILFLSISAFFTYLSYKSVKKTIKAFSNDNNKDHVKDSID